MAFGHAHHDVVAEDATVLAEGLLSLDLGLVLKMHPGGKRGGEGDWDEDGKEIEMNKGQGNKKKDVEKKTRKKKKKKKKKKT